MVTLAPVGAANGRVPVPAGATVVATLAAFETELNKVLPGGANVGDSVDLHMSGTLYDEIGIRNYNCTDGGTGLRIYGNQDGSTVIHWTNSGMFQANSAAFRLGSADNQFQTNTRIELYNVQIDGNSTSGSTGAVWGVILGASYDNDPNRGNVFEIIVRGVEIYNTRNSGIKIDGNGGTDGVELAYMSVHDVGKQNENQGGVEGLGEMYYCGDGNTHRAFNDLWIHHCYGDGGGDNFGEGINTKRNGTNVRIEDTLIENVLIDNGGGISCVEYVEVRRCRVRNVTRNGNSDTSFPPCFHFSNGGLLENNIGWTDVSGGVCLKLDDDGPGTVTATNNTWNATGARTVYSLNEFTGGGGQTLVALDNLYSGDLSEGSNGAGGSINDVAAGTFVGPTTGTADAGSGVGSGFELVSGGGRNAVTALAVVNDIQGYARVSPTDAGAIDADAVSGGGTTANAVDDTNVNFTIGATGSFDASANDTAPGGSDWIAVSGVPAGMSFSTAGVLSGTPTSAGVLSLVYQIEETPGVAADTATVSGTISPTTTSDSRCYFFG